MSAAATEARPEEIYAAAIADLLQGVRHVAVGIVLLIPGTGALLGRGAAETRVRALEAAGPDLTVDSFLAAVEALDYEDAIAGTRISFGEDHLGSSKVYISKIEGGSWKVIGEAGE